MAWPETPCEACPLVARQLPGPCPAQTRRHARFCASTRAVAAGVGTEIDAGHVRFLSGEVPPPVPEPPGLLRKAANFAGAVAGHVAAGMPTLSTAETDARLAACGTCEMYRDSKCSLCGCSNMRMKASWSDQVCPHPAGDKWAL